MKPRIIFFDIDGTLVPLKEGIRPRTVEALQKLRQNGIRLCIATGRTPMEMPKFEGVTFDALLTYNGSYCFTPERDIFKNLIPKEDIVTLRRNAAALGRPLALATDSRLVANGTEPDLEEYFAIGGVKLVVADDFDEVAQGEVFQVLMGGREEEYPRHPERCHPCQDRRLVGPRSGHHPGQRRQGGRGGKGAGILRHRQGRQHGVWRRQQRHRDVRGSRHRRCHGQCL